MVKVPGRPRRRLAPGDRRAELVDAALRLLRRGVDEGNWVAEVTAEAGAAKGTFYVYFRSWDHMLGTVRDRLLDDYNVPVRRVLEAPAGLDLWGVLESQCERFIDVMIEFRRHHGLIFHSPLSDWPTEHTRTAGELLAALIVQGVRLGVFGPVDPDMAATLLFSAVHATADAVLAGADRTRWVAEWMALARGYLAPPAPPRRRRERGKPWEAVLSWGISASGRGPERRC